MGDHAHGVWLLPSSPWRGVHECTDPRMEQPEVVVGAYIESARCEMQVNSAPQPQEGQGAGRSTERCGHHRSGCPRRMAPQRFHRMLGGSA